MFRESIIQRAGEEDTNPSALRTWNEWMDLENILLREITKSEKDKYLMMSLLWNLTNKTNL